MINKQQVKKRTIERIYLPIKYKIAYDKNTIYNIINYRYNLFNYMNIKVN